MKGTHSARMIASVKSMRMHCPVCFIRFGTHHFLPHTHTNTYFKSTTNSFMHNYAHTLYPLCYDPSESVHSLEKWKKRKIRPRCRLQCSSSCVWVYVEEFNQEMQQCIITCYQEPFDAIERTFACATESCLASVMEKIRNSYWIGVAFKGAQTHLYTHKHNCARQSSATFIFPKK